MSAPGGVLTNPAMSYYNPNGALSAMPTGGGYDPQLSMMMMGGNGPQSPYAKKMDEAATQVLGDPSSYSGILSRSQDEYDQAKNSKLAAIKRASELITGSRGFSNTPLMKFAAGLSSAPTLSGSLGNAFSSAADEINKQREQERLIANSVGNLGIEGADVDMQGALQSQGALDKRMGLYEHLENAASQDQNRSDLNNTRQRIAAMQAQARITSADIAADKGRYKPTNQITQDGNYAVYLDSKTGQNVLGPPVQQKVGGAGGKSVSQWKYDMWLASHQGDTQGALDFVAGHRTMSPQDQYKYARSEAAKELGSGADEQEIEATAKKIIDSMGAHGGASAPAAQPPVAARAPQSGDQHQLTPQEVQQSIANAKQAISQNPAARQKILDRLKQSGIPTTGL